MDLRDSRMLASFLPSPLAGEGQGVRGSWKIAEPRNAR
jgi:hypothetical protein